MIACGCAPGIGLVEYELHDLTNGSSVSLPKLSHYALPLRSFYAYGLQLLHNHRYTVTATPRNGVNGLGTPCASSVTLVDLTPPTAGIVYVVHSDELAFADEPERTPLAAHYQWSVQAIRITTRRFADNESVLLAEFDPISPRPSKADTSCARLDAASVEYSSPSYYVIVM